MEGSKSLLCFSCQLCQKLFQRDWAAPFAILLLADPGWIIFEFQLLHLFSRNWNSHILPRATDQNSSTLSLHWIELSLTGGGKTYQLQWMVSKVSCSFYLKRKSFLGIIGISIQRRYQFSGPLCNNNLFLKNRRNIPVSCYVFKRRKKIVRWEIQILSRVILKRTDHLAVKSRAASYKSHTHLCLKSTSYHGYHDTASFIYSPALYILLSRRHKRESWLCRNLGTAH